MTIPADVSTSTHYAIRLPNGKLCSEIPNDLRVGLMDLRVMPTGDHAYLWPDNNEGGARATIGRIADTMKRFGARELFERNAHVVRVVLSAEVIGPACIEPPDVGE